VHAEGLWHRSFHCWVVRASQRGPELLLQRRAQTKDTWPGAWDVSAAGHYRPGEGLEGGLREVAEELGLELEAGALTWLERHAEVKRYPNGLRDRERQDVYLTRCDWPLDAYAPDPSEVTGLVLLPAATLVRVARGELPRAWAVGRTASGSGWTGEQVRVTRASLVPRTGAYFERIARAAARLVGH
jgi:isopentenyldiphosphate isomerase